MVKTSIYYGITELEKLPESESSVQYLRNKEIIEQAVQILNDIDAREISITHIRISKLLLPHLELLVEIVDCDNTINKWVMNFWPCRQCKCVGFLPYKK